MEIVDDLPKTIRVYSQRIKEKKTEDLKKLIK